MNPQNNLDYLTAKHARQLIDALPNAKEAENTITKTLGVLQENGVYACFLYLRANGKDTIINGMLDLLKTLDIGNPPETNAPQDVLKYIADDITADLHRLLLAKEALEQMLIYARYHAKAQQKE